MPNVLDGALLPERRGVFGVDVCWLPLERARVYGASASELARALGLQARRGRAPLVLHPKATRAQEELAAQEGVTRSRLVATPTASYRTVLAFGRAAPPRCLKLSLGANVAGAERAVTEPDIARGIVVSHLLDGIAPADRGALGLHWFREHAAVVETRSGHGYLVRDLPDTLPSRDGRFLLPAFSLTSERPGRKRPLLEQWVRRTKMAPEAFVIERLVYPYVSVLSHLLLSQGIELEGHGQNVLFEVDDHGPTGNVALRDLSDASVNLALRIAQQKPLPPLAARLVPPGAPFLAVAEVSDLSLGFEPRRRLGGRETVESFGLNGFLWPIQVAATRLFPGYDARKVERAYLASWQFAATRYLGVRPLLASRRTGLAMDEAIAHFVDHVDWRSLGARRASRLPRGALGLPLALRSGRHEPSARLETPWGSLWLHRGRPAAFRPVR